jgi:hypothetical protein
LVSITIVSMQKLSADEINKLILLKMSYEEFSILSSRYMSNVKGKELIFILH